MKKINLLAIALFFIANGFSQTVPDFTAMDVHGNEHHLYEYLDAGKYVLLDFFFTTCSGCINVAPDLNAAAQRYGCNQGDIIFLGIDRYNTDEEVLAFEEQYGGYYPVISGIDGGADSIIQDYHVSKFPTVAIIAPDRTFITDDLEHINTHGLDDAIAITAGIDENPEACNTTVIHETKNNYQLIISPNPVGNTVTIQATLPENTTARLLIRNQLGQFITTPVILFSEKQNINNFDFSNLTTGIYFLQLITNKKIIALQKFSKL